MGEKKRYQLVGLFLLMTVFIAAVPSVRQWMGATWYFAPIFWGVLLVLILCLFPRMHVPGGLRLKNAVLGYAVSGAVICVALSYVAGGILRKLTATPYDISPAGILYNLLTFLPLLAARELIRAHSLGTIWRTLKFRRMAVVLLVLFMAVTEVNLTKAGKIKGNEEIFIYIVTDVIPVFTRNILATTLVFYGGAGAGILYGGLLQIFQRCAPFLPELPWIANSAIGICFPVLYAMIIKEQCQLLEGEQDTKEEGSTAVYLAGLFFAVAFSWFCVGVFPVYPSVVLTGSMEPEIKPGDVVLIRKLMEEKELYQLAEHDVINFRRDDISITHRITEVVSDKAGNRTFRTKGDNNASEDERLVKPNEVKGRVVKVVPKVGGAVLILKNDKSVPEGVTDDEREEEDRMQ